MIASIIIINSCNKNDDLPIFGDDLFSGEKDGFEDGEMITFRIFNPSTNERNDLIPQFDQSLNFGVPCYTGDVKTEIFMKLLKHWNPEAIIVFVLGQIFNAAIINFPGYGIYNFHPTDLAKHYGADPNPSKI